MRERALALARTPYALILAGYVLLRLGGFYGVETLQYRDTAGYLEVASHSIFSLDFLGGGRSWTVPLAWKLLPDSDSARSGGQFLISIACWPLLAAAVARALRSPGLRPVAFGLVLLFSLSLAVIRWDTVMLSESISISLTALVLAGWLELVREPRPWLVPALLGATLLWVFARDSNGILALLTVPVALYWVVRPGPLGRAWPAVLAGGTLAIFAAGLLATTTDQAQLRRNERPILHVIGRRVLADEAKTRWWRDHGMPDPPPLVIRERASLAGIAEGGIPSDPETDAFLEWAREHGRGTLARYLLTHPGYTLKSAIGKRQRLLGGVTGGYLSPDARIVVPEPLDRLVYPRTAQDVYFWLVAIGLGAVAVALTAGARRVWLVPAAALALQVPHALVVYHGDTLEVPRHAMLVAITSRLALLMLALMVLDRVLELRGGRMFDGRPTAPAGYSHLSG
ncbi:MAG TPA: hypothetical protein VNB64_12275 [Solirubrobacteraceae bacterium]|nr:hypothetical protein [Solirubrobacteraceae bacterium]